MDKILVMLSGGIDSTAALYALLTEEKYKNYDIAVHHMHLINIENRWRAEQFAVSNIINELTKDFGPLEFTTTSYEYMVCHKNIFMDLFMYAMSAAQIAFSDHSITKIAIGRNKDDDQNFHMQTPQYTPMAQMLFKNLMAVHTPQTDADYIFPIVHMDKQQVWDYLPEKIRDLTWSCRKPIYIGDLAPVECDVCPTCKSIAKLKNVKKT